MSLSPFWADVLRPAFHAFAPEDPVVLAKRARNAAVLAACLSSMLPHHAPLGVGTTMDANLLLGVYAAVAIVAHVRRGVPRGALESAVALALAGIAPWVTSSGQASWGIWLGLAALGHVALGAWRRANVRLPARPLQPDPRPRRGRGIPHFLDRVGYGLATVLVFWSFVTMHTKVPTGSMQPTILGDHGRGRFGGDRVLADHMIYSLREPRRFDIVVFRYPLRRDILFVKRLVGLPGETIEIKEGDIWVDGSVARKPAIVQASLWQELFPRKASAPTAKPRSVANAWTATEDDGWRKEGDAALRVKPRSERETVAAFRDRLSVADVRVGFDAEPVDPAAVAVLRVLSRGHVVTMEVPASGDGAVLRGIEGEEVRFAATLGKRARVELAVADGLARAIVDGRELASLKMPAVGAGRNRAEVGARGGELVLRVLRLHEDVYYATTPSGTNAFETGSDQYVMLGDNSRNSADSRLWRGRSFRVEGREHPYVAEDMSPDLSGGQVRNVVRADGRVRFIDSDGLPRDIAASSIVEEIPPAAMPYVPRADLVGRAALIFWPVPPFGSSFRPRLIP